VLSNFAQNLSKHSFANTHIELPKHIADKITEFNRRIPKEDLAEDEQIKPHVTVKYGLHENTLPAVKKVLGNERPVKFTMGKLHVFPADNQHDSDVLVSKVESPDLVRLNSKLAALPHTDTYSDYQPHATIAYLKPGKGSQYLAKHGLEGLSGSADSVVHSDVDDTETNIPLQSGLVTIDAGLGDTATLDGGVWTSSDPELAHLLNVRAQSTGLIDDDEIADDANAFLGLDDEQFLSRFAQNLDASSDCDWKTINGTHVCIKDGEVEKGPASLKVESNPQGESVAEKVGLEVPTDEKSAKELGVALRQASEDQFGEDLHNQCREIAQRLYLAYRPYANILEGSYPGDYEEGGHHYITNVNGFVFDVSADQFGGPKISVTPEDDLKKSNYSGFRTAKITEKTAEDSFGGKQQADKFGESFAKKIRSFL